MKGLKKERKNLKFIVYSSFAEVEALARSHMNCSISFDRTIDQTTELHVRTEYNRTENIT